MDGAINGKGKGRTSRAGDGRAGASSGREGPALTSGLSEQWDVVVIGAGIAGCFAARELARWDVRVLVLEAGNDIACGATRANSGIVHAGYDPLPGTLKARYNVAGARLFPQISKELDVPFQNNGSMVVAFDAADCDVLRELERRAAANGAEGVFVVDGEEARRLEPNLSPDVTAALVVDAGAICDPYLTALAAAENAVENGVAFLFNQEVVGFSRAPEGAWRVRVASGEAYAARTVVNAAGVYSDVLNNLAGGPTIEVMPRRGEYCLYDADYGRLFRRTIFQTPGKAGKGVLVAPTVHGNLLVGPNAVEQESRQDVSTTREGLDCVLEHARRTWPQASQQGVITNFAGLRASGGPSSAGDFVIGEAPGAPGFFNIACFDSPGLTSAPAVAVDIAAAIARLLDAGRNGRFDPVRRAAKPFALMDDRERAEAIRQDVRYGSVVCRCGEVTEAEVVAALHGPLPVLSLDALKWRCRAMMGRCHGGFCMPELAKIVARELGCAPDEVDKRLPGSYVVAHARHDYVALAKKEDRMAGQAACAACWPKGLRQRACDVVVVGGGAAGMAAACAACDAGAARVLLVDREHGMGGILRQCIHNGFGLHRYGEELTGPEYASRLAAELSDRPIDVLPGATVLRIDAADGGFGDHAVELVCPDGEFRVEARAVVLATGSRERGFGALNIAGSRPSGIFTAGSAQAFMNLQGCLPGKRAVVLGSGDIGLIMARRMAWQGMDVVSVHEIMARPSGLRRNIAQCLDDFAIPLYLSSTVVRVEGADRLEAVWVADVDPDTLRPIPQTERRIACDTLVLSVGLIPENEVAKSAGVVLSDATGGAAVDDLLATSVPGVFACGNALHIHDLADFASEEGLRAGVSAAAWARAVANGERAADVRRQSGAGEGAIPLEAGEGVRYVVPQRLAMDAGGGSVVVRLRTAEALRNPRFLVEGVRSDGTTTVLARKRAMVAVPAEMAEVEFKKDDARGCVIVRVRVEGGRL